MKCIICGSTNNNRTFIIHGVEIYTCNKCELGFIDISKFKETNLEKLYDINAYEKERKRIEDNIIKLLNIINKYKSEGEVLDIGVGFGLFSSLLYRTGKYTLDVIDPSNQPFYLNEIPHTLYRKHLQEYKPRKKYDVILLIDVIEHFSNPIQSLTHIRNLLNKDGIIVIQTPNYKSLMRYISKDWSWWMIEDHKFFFSSKAFKTLVLLLGCQIKYFNTYESWIDLKKNFDGNFSTIENPIIRKLMKVLVYISFFPFYFLIRNFIWKLGYGGLIFSISKKDN